MNKFFDNIESNHKVMITAIVALLLLGMLSFFFNIDNENFLYTTLIPLGILAVIIFTFLGKTKNTIRYYSLTIVLTVAFLALNKPWFKYIFEFLFAKYLPEYTHKSFVVDNSSLFVMGFVLIGIFIVNYFIREGDGTAMGIAKTPIDDIVPQSSINEQMQRVVESLNDDLRSIDIKTNWSIRNFVPLDAEVEVITGNRKQKRITNLLDAIQKSNDRLFLVLGDPGSGKSVSLRKLARELSNESKKTGKIPIYINLKEWNFTDRDKKPTVEDIKSFVLDNIINRDIVLAKFFKKYFDRLYDEGILYFIFDSFDEIPMLLDEHENSELIDYYSQLFFKFLKGARAENSQGVLASRIFRKPTNQFQVNTTLEIRPFDDEKIINMFTNLGAFSDELKQKLFKERYDLIPVARNPFTAQLIADYAEKNSNNLPDNQAQMYKNYIVSTLQSCEDRLQKANLSIDRVFELSIEIAQLMFEEHGFEIAKPKLIEHFDRDEIESVISILKFARLGRIGNSEEYFSFVHRRFAEYFIVEKMIEDESINVDYKSIPEDSKWRDALVLYCEVASFEKAQEIANFCWETISTINDPKDIRVIHTVRFLRDAFKARKECLVDFEEYLAEYLDKQIDKENNTIQVKLAVESVGLLSPKYMDELIVKAFKLNNYWINDTALKSCRHLERVSDDLIISLKKYIITLPLHILYKNKNDIKFSLGLSSAFKNNKLFLQKYIYVFYLIFLIIILGFISDSLFSSIYFIEVLKNYILLFTSVFLLFFFFILNNKRSNDECDCPKNNKYESIKWTTTACKLTLKDYTYQYKKYNEKYHEKCLNSILPLYLLVMNTFMVILALASSCKNSTIFTIDLLETSSTIIADSTKSVTFFPREIIVIPILLLLILHVNKHSSLTLSEQFMRLIMSIPKAVMVIVILILASSWMILKNIILIILIGLNLFLTYSIFKYLLQDYCLLEYPVVAIYTFIFFVIIVLPIINFFHDIIKVRVAFKANISTRKEVQKYYERIHFDFMKIKLLNHIDANYKEIKGEWSDESILNVSSSKADIKLAQLEQKWRGIDG